MLFLSSLTDPAGAAADLVYLSAAAASGQPATATSLLVPQSLMAAAGTDSMGNLASSAANCGGLLAPQPMHFAAAPGLPAFPHLTSAPNIPNFLAQHAHQPESLLLLSTEGTALMELTQLEPPPQIQQHSQSSSAEAYQAPATQPAAKPTSPCERCGGEIFDRYFCFIGDASWHEACCRCSVCQRELAQDASCFYRQRELYCRRDYTLKFCRRVDCARCGELIEMGEAMISAGREEEPIVGGNATIFHLRCFNCTACGRQMRSGELYTMMGGESQVLLCQNHLQTHLEASRGYHHECADEESGQHTDDEISNGGSNANGGELSNSSSGALNVSCFLAQPSSADGCGGGGSSVKGKRMRTSFKHHQLRTMKTYFSLNHNPDAKDLKQLAQKTGLTKRVLQVWFQNARAKFRRAQHHHQLQHHQKPLGGVAGGPPPVGAGGGLAGPIGAVPTIQPPQYNNGQLEQLG